MTPPEYKRYLGDAVYVHFDGYHVVLTTNNGIVDTNTILLDPSVIGSFGRYLEALRTELNSIGQRLVIPTEKQ